MFQMERFLIPLETRSISDKFVGKIRESASTQRRSSSFRPRPATPKSPAGGVYTIALDADGMAAAANAIAPDIESLDIDFTEGNLEIVLSGNDLSSITISCGGRLRLLLTDTDVSIPRRHYPGGTRIRSHAASPQRIAVINQNQKERRNIIMANRIICIGRQFGSGGHEIAVKTANQLGIKVYERELIRLACEYGELSEKAMSAADEKATNPLPVPDRPRGELSRCADGRRLRCCLRCKATRSAGWRSARNVSLGGAAPTLTCGSRTCGCCVCSSPRRRRHRVARKMEQERLSHNQAVQLVRKMDKQRKKYYESYTGQVWGAPQFHDLCLDTSRFSIPECVELIVTKFLTL